MVFDPHPPYTILANKHLDFMSMQRLVRFARYWDLVANSGRFANTVQWMLGDAPFENFMDFSNWLYANTDATHRIAMEKLAKLVAQWLQTRGLSAQQANSLVASDYAGGAKAAQHASPAEQPKAPPLAAALPQRQARHLAS